MSALAGYIKDDKDYLQFFWDLASDEDDVRNNAAHKLTVHLQEIAASTDAVKAHEYQEYTLKRLVRGLTSPRDEARQGFAVALCQVLGLFPYRFDEVMSMIDEYAQVRNDS